MSAFICLQFGQDNMTTPIAQSTSENWQMFAATNCRRKLDLALPTWQGAQESESLGEAWRSYLSGFESDWRLVWTSSRTHIIWPKEQQIYLSCPNEQAHPQIQDPGRIPISHLSYEDVIGSRCALCEALESAPRDPPQPLAAVSWHDSKVMTVGLFGGHKQRKPEREREVARA